MTFRNSTKAVHGRPKHSDIRGATSISDAFFLHQFRILSLYRGRGGEQFNLNGKVVSLRLGDYFALCQNLEKAHLGRECRIAGNVGDGNLI